MPLDAGLEGLEPMTDANAMPDALTTRLAKLGVETLIVHPLETIFVKIVKDLVLHPEASFSL
jgi:hypothetical protein